MIKSFDIKVNNKIELFQYWLASINWTLGKNSLTEAELKILSYFLYYNDKYKSIEDQETRTELLFSTSVKKKIKEEFKINAQKLETYLNKLRKKGIINATNLINPSFIIYPENKLILSYNFLSTNIVSTPSLDEKVSEPITHITSNEEPTDLSSLNIIQEELSTTESSSTNLWDKYMNEGQTTSVSNWNEEE